MGKNYQQLCDTSSDVGCFHRVFAVEKYTIEIPKKTAVTNGNNNNHFLCARVAPSTKHAIIVF